ncbi:MAG TPA: 50S ribosomal protein L11 methyltransferase [Stellaceae bacterium]|nr:50S ribosomal protein L11 methyltransferase [Stellaceae bacterium]
MTDPAAFIRANTETASPPLVPEIRLHLASEVTPLWQMTERELDRHNLPPPYWAFAWPGGQALARYLLDHPDTVRGRRVWDIGAGGGLASIAALKAGAASATAFEIDPFALAAIALNGALNGVAALAEAREVLAEPFAGEADLILIGDMCYERPLAERLVAWLQTAAGRAEILLADPGRAYLPKTGLELVISYAVPTSLDLEDRAIRTTAIYRLAVA